MYFFCKASSRDFVNIFLDFFCRILQDLTKRFTKNVSNDTYRHTLRLHSFTCILYFSMDSSRNSSRILLRIFPWNFSRKSSKKIANNSSRNLSICFSSSWSLEGFLKENSEFRKNFWKKTSKESYFFHIDIPLVFSTASSPEKTFGSSRNSFKGSFPTRVLLGYF